MVNRESRLTQAEKPRPARIFAAFADILQGKQFENAPGSPKRSNTRKVELADQASSYLVSHTRFLGGRGGWETLDSYTLQVANRETNQLVRFHYSQNTMQLHVDGSLATNQEGWQAFEDALKQAQAAEEVTADGGQI